MEKHFRLAPSRFWKSIWPLGVEHCWHCSGSERKTLKTSWTQLTIHIRNSAGGRSTSVSLAEVTEILQHLHSSLWDFDTFCPDLLKALSVYGLSGITLVLNIAWKSGEEPKDCLIGVVVLPLKWGTKEWVQSTEASQSSALLGTFTGKDGTDDSWILDWRGAMQILSWLWNNWLPFHSCKDLGKAPVSSPNGSACAS